MPTPTGLTVVTAPRLEPLFDRLAGALASDPLPPQEKEVIVIARNVGLRAWLTHTLARRLGCAASLDLPSPVQFVSRLAGMTDGLHPFEAGPLAWRLAPLLRRIAEADEGDPVYAPLRAYLHRTGGQAMPLAKRLAALFDDYQVYRPDVLAAWAEGRDPHPDFAHGAWQAALWRALRADGEPDRASRFAQVERELARERPRLALPTRLAVFGGLVFPPVYYRILAGLARHRPVTLYAVTVGDRPSTEPHAHPLLRALGERTRVFWQVLADLGAAAPERIGPPRLDAGAGALHQLQAALADDVPPTARPLDPLDRSLRILDCHSEVRELEALRDELLDAFAELEGLRPSDVLVLLPDLDRYAPLVDAVFGAEDATGRDGFRLPYHVAHHPHAPALRVIEAFHKALRLHDGRVTASELLDLLDYPPVRRRADIGEDELPMLRAWVKEAGVCWGLGADRKAAFGLPEDDLHTWRFGLDRLLLGVATGAPGGAGLVLGHLPCDAAGLDGADLLGRFSEWAEALFDALRVLDRPRCLGDWPDALLLFVDGLLAPRDDEEVEAVVFLRQLAGDLAQLYALAGEDDGAVTFYAVRAHLESTSGAFERQEPYLTGRVTFADPLALRYAPHRVVAFVGLGDGVFPAPEDAPGFDLIAHAPRPGDAAPRQMEKQLFLDALLAARDRLILSYVGHSQKDNSERAASVVLDALLDAAERHWGPEARKHLVVSHRLQPFAGDYFAKPTRGTPARLFSYAAQHRVRRLGDGALRPFLDADDLARADAEAPDTVALADLVFAWTNPSRFVLGRRLRVSLDLDEATIRDDEPVALDGLGRFKVRQAALDGLLDGLPEEAVAERLLRSGLLPGGAPGAAWLRQALDAVAPIAQSVRAWGATRPLPVVVEVEGGLVVGSVERVNERGALRFRPGSIREKDLVAAWVDHLALCASDARRTCTLGTADSCHFDALDPDDARMLLQALVRGYHVIRRTVPPLFERASYTYVDKLNGAQRKAWTDRILQRERAVAGLGDGRHNGTPDVHDWAMQQARKAFDGGFGRDGDRADAYVALATRGRDPFADDPRAVHQWAACLWAPLLEHRRPGLPA